MNIAVNEAQNTWPLGEMGVRGREKDAEQNNLSSSGAVEKERWHSGVQEVLGGCSREPRGRCGFPLSRE